MFSLYNAGRDSVCVFAHDFKWPMGPVGPPRNDHATIKDTYMDRFRSNQPTTFECCKLAMICGRLNEQVDIDREDWEQLEVFLHQCRVHPESFNNPSDGYNNYSSDPNRLRNSILVVLGAVIVIIVALIRSK